MNWKQEEQDNGQESYQLDVRMDRIVVARDGNEWDSWRWKVLDGDGNVTATEGGYDSADDAKLAALWWVRRNGTTLYAASLGVAI